MQYKYLSEFRITHFSGEVETLNASNMLEALENTSISDSKDTIIQAYRTQGNTKTVVAELMTEVPFHITVEEGQEAAGNVATPASGVVHVGDQITLEAFAKPNYEFVEWKRNGEVLGTDAKFLYTMTEPKEGDVEAVFTAVFAYKPVSWGTKVEPPEASVAGCVTFPKTGRTDVGELTSMIAVGKDGYNLVRWERNGKNLGAEEILETLMEPLAEGETEALYTAIFEKA